MNVRPFMQYHPRIKSSVWIDPSAIIIGNTTIGRNSSVWPNSVIRGDVKEIRIGEETNIQEGSVLHCTHDSVYYRGGYELSIGDQVTIGHKACLHGCFIGNQILIGIGSIILDGARIEDKTMLAAGTLVPPKKLLKSGHLYMGSPAKATRELTSKELNFLEYSAEHYVKLAQLHKKQFKLKISE